MNKYGIDFDNIYTKSNILQIVTKCK